MGELSQLSVETLTRADHHIPNQAPHLHLLLLNNRAAPPSVYSGSMFSMRRASRSTTTASSASSSPFPTPGSRIHKQRFMPNNVSALLHVMVWCSSQHQVEAPLQRWLTLWGLALRSCPRRSTRQQVCLSRHLSCPLCYTLGGGVHGGLNRFADWGPRGRAG